MSPIPTPASPGGPTVAHYRLLTRIGSGAMADVFRVVRTNDGGWSRSYVLKRVREELRTRPEFVEQFRTEAKLGMALCHPHIARALDVIDNDSVQALVFDHAPGADFLKMLEAATRQGVRIAPHLVATIITQVASALGHLHKFASAGTDRGWIHRDVSPANIIVSHAGAVQLIDFGIALPLTGQSVVVTRRGKIGYLAPETVLNGEISEKSDLFALATVLWEALTLRRLFKTGDDLETLRNIAGVVVEARFARHAWVPEPLMGIIRKGLAKNPADRHASMEEFENELRAWVGREHGGVSCAEIGALCRQLIPTPYEEALTNEKTTTTTGEFRAPLDLSALESIIDAMDTDSGREGLEALIQGHSSWLPETHRVTRTADNEGWTAEDRAAQAETFDALSSDQRRAGELDRFDPAIFPAILVSLSRRSFSGVISVRSQKRVKQLHFRGGEIVRIASNIKNERLATRLESRGLIEAATRIRALELQRDTGMRIGEALVATAPACADVVKEALETEVVERLTELLRWTVGDVSFESWDEDPRADDGGEESHDTELITAAAVRAAWTPDECLSLLEPWLDATIIPLEPVWPAPEWLTLGERAHWPRLYKQSTLRAALTGMPSDESGRVAYLGLVTLRHTFMLRSRSADAHQEPPMLPQSQHVH